MPESIVVTGLGAISSLGMDVAENWASARAGVTGIKPHLLDPGPHGPPPVTRVAAIMQGDWLAALEAALGRRIGQTFDPFAAFALKASHEALGHAGLLGQPLGSRAAVVMGNGIGGLTTLEKAYERFFGLKATKIHPMTVPRVMVSALVSAVAMEFGVTGPVFATSSACASAGHAIIQGAGLIATGMVDVAVVGGSECIGSPGGIRSWEGLQAMSDTMLRPFSAGRDGMAIGDGAAALVIERRSHAEARGAPILAEFLGGGMTSDAGHLTQPGLEGVVGAMRQAGAPGGFLESGAGQVLISAHGTGTPLNDKNEAEAIRAVFGDAAASTPVIATKSAHGHTLGATAALQAVLALKALETGYAPPILGYLGPDEDCAGLDLVLGEARPISIRNLLVNAFAFGGLNVCLAFRR